MSVRALVREQVRPLIRGLVRGLFGAGTPAGEYLGDEDAGLSIDFANNNALVRGHTSSYSGNVAGLLTVTRASAASYFDSAGVQQQATNNVLRLDHNPVTLAARGALIEEARTNLLLQSAAFGTTWTTSSNTVTSNTQSSPEGAVTGDTLTSTTAGASGVQQAVTTTVAAHTFSVFAKAGSLNWLRLVGQVSGSSTNLGAWFNLATGVVGTKQSLVTTSTIQNIGNGWFRCAITYTGSASAEQVIIRLADADASLNSGVGGTVHVWGAQLEVGTFPTSYIPTTTTQATRAADQVSLATSAFPLNTAEGTFVVEFTNGADLSMHVLNLSNGTTAERVVLFENGAGIIVRVDDGAATQASMTKAQPVSGDSVKAAYAFALNSFAFSKNGDAPATDSVGTLPTVTKLSIGSDEVGTGFLANAHFKRLKYLPRRASDAELQAMAA